MRNNNLEEAKQKSEELKIALKESGYTQCMKDNDSMWEKIIDHDDGYHSSGNDLRITIYSVGGMRVECALGCHVDCCGFDLGIHEATIENVNNIYLDYVEKFEREILRKDQID